MRPLPVFVTVLLTAALAYYIYIPLPDAIQEPWRLMMLDAALRTTMALVSMDLTVAVGDRCHSAGVKLELVCTADAFTTVAFSKDRC